MPFHDQADFNLENLPAILDQLHAAITVTDLEGKMLYYNENATQLTNIKPEYLGQDVRNCHKKESSKKRIDSIIEGFKAGNYEPYTYKTEVKGVPVSVTIVPFIDSGKVSGCIHQVVKM